MAAPARRMTPAEAMQMNLAFRQNLLTRSQPMKQQIFSQTIATPGTTGNVINIPFRNVGLITGFLVGINATLTNAGAAAGALTTFGGANILSNITLTDYDTYQRMNVPGWYLAFLNAQKEGFPVGAAILAASIDQGTGQFGNNFDVVTQGATIADSGGTATIKMWYWVPCAYSGTDLRGAIWGGIVNATAQLSLTLNPAPGATTGDATLAVYSGANTATTITSATVTVYQFFQDQVPQGPDGRPLLPELDVGTQYRLQQTTLTGIAASQDFPIPFTNFQEFLSTAIVYNQAGTLSNGSDVNYLSVTAANTLNFLKMDPFAVQLLTRTRNRIDFPRGVYMLDFRDQPIATNQSGNMQVNLNASSAAAQSTVMVGWESFAFTNAILGAASLAAG